MKIKSVLSLSLCMAMMMSVSVKAESRMLGDVDGDGEISITDATVIQRYTVGIKTPVAVTSSVADIDGDHVVTVMDASHLQRRLVNVSDSYPISKPVYEPSPTDRYVTVEGVTFDLKKVPSEVTLTDKNITLMIVPQSEIDPHDITTVVNNSHYINQINYTDSRFKESHLIEKENGILHGYDCEVTDREDNPLAYVYAHYRCGLYFPFQTTISCIGEAHGSFPIELYYKGELIRRVNIKVDVNHTPDDIEKTLQIVRSAEKARWTSSMTDREKMKAFAEYIRDHYTYDQIMCVEGAVLTAFAARDLGLESMLLYPGGELNQHCGRHIFTYNLYANTAVPGGHCACLVEYNDCTMRYDVQGELCIIKEYNKLISFSVSSKSSDVCVENF